MSNKTNNLKAYLRDLYEGIVSKKPDASRNPQNFRSEIEAIRTGGEFYEVMDVSELPNDAPDGSLALVEGEPISNDPLVGVWAFRAEIEIPPEFVGKKYLFEFINYLGKYEGFWFYGEGSIGYMTTSTSYKSAHTADGWVNENKKVIEILTPPVEAEFIAWLQANATKSTSGSTSSVATAYTVSSIGELPKDVIEGSLAKVRGQHSFYGTYYLALEISMPYTQFENVFFECDGRIYKTIVGYGNLQYETREGEYITVYENGAWIDAKYSIIKVTLGENTALKQWLNENRETFSPMDCWECYEFLSGSWSKIDPNRPITISE